MMIAEAAPAKINVALHVRRRRADGYHDIETLFAFARDGDLVEAEPANGFSLEIVGSFATELPVEESNLVLRAARALGDASGGGRGARLRLTKRLPVASGIGGGSADAAATLRLLARLWDVDVPDELAAALGADVPACLLGRTAWGDGRGFPLRPVAPDTLAGRPLLLVNPGVPVSTGAVFARWDGVDRGGLAPTVAAALAGRNDLEAPAGAITPVLGELLARMAALPDASLVRMSGSGATCFALFDDPRACARAADAMAAAMPNAWCLATTLA